MTLYVLQTIRTNNFNDQEMAIKINHVWEASLKELGAEKQVMYGIYHQYASNYRGDYNLSIATTEIKTSEMLTVAKQATYQIFQVDQQLENAVYQTWLKIWELEDQGMLNRAYSLDYEKYALDGSVTIHIAIK